MAIANTNEPTLSEKLAAYATTLKYEDLPPEVALTAKRIVLDTIGCAIGGHTAGPAQIALKLASGVSATQPATVMCSGVRTTPEMAVFANGVMIRYLDFNDGFISLGGGHPSDSLAALLTPAELYGRSGRDLLVALVIAYEVYTKFTDVIEMRELGLDQSTILGLASVVAAGRLMGLTKEQLTNAIGITLGGNTALNQGRVGTLSNWKAYACAEASRKATFSAQLALAGMTGPREVFEGRDGFFNVINRKPFEPAPFGGRDAPFGIMRASTKRFALGQFAQTVAQAAMEAREFCSDPGQIAEINVHVSTNAIHVMADSPDKWRPQTHETADHSMPYSVGVILMYGMINENYYEAPYLHDQKLLDLVAKVKAIPSEEAARRHGEINLCELELVLKSGQRNTTRVEYHRGHWKNPMSEVELSEKFRGLAGRYLNAERVESLLAQLWKLDDLPKAGVILELTRV